MSLKVFLNNLRRFIPEDRIITDEIRRFALSTDASFYRLLPKVVLRLDNEAEVVTTLRLARRYKIPVTFRAAGTSLSGQAVSDSVLITLTENWNDLRIEPLGEILHAQPGLIGGKVNAALKPYGRKIGPDPASIDACKLGGIVANNASGMCCGIKHNSYHTLHGMRLVLTDGTILDSRDQESVAMFRESHKTLLDELLSLRAQVLSHPALYEKIRHQYRLKNTTGYGLNALLDFEDPIDILTHLVVGSEGTLGFISEVSLRTVDDFSHRASAFVGFDNLTDCVKAVEHLKTESVDAVELFDSKSIKAVIDKPGLPDFARQLPPKGGVLLIDIRGDSQASLELNVNNVNDALRQCAILSATEFTQSSHLIEQYWNIRKGTFPAVGAERAAGSAVMIEDVAFPINSLAEGVDRLQQLFEQFGYDDAIIFGHALEGNLHFVFTQRFDDPAEVDRYGLFMDALAKMVTVDLQGSLKAEHGTGRNMAPFVELEWGADAFDLMKRIKHIFDPAGVLNPGVILNDDPKVHLKDLKMMVPSDDIIDGCIECGFCEDVCPSQKLSFTPRQRIATYREINRRQQAKEAISKEWERSFQGMAVDACAATGLCELTCPVGINTGELVLKIRGRNNAKYRRVANSLARHFAAVAGWVRFFLALSFSLQRLIGPDRLYSISRRVRRLTRGRTPVWLATTPKRNKPIYSRIEQIDPGASDTVVYWSSCTSQSMGGSIVDDRKSIPDSVQNVLKKAKLNVVYPQPTRGLCCGQPFRSKGHSQVADQMAAEVLDALWEVSSAGRYPVLSDSSPCALQLRSLAAQRGIHLYDSSEFIDRFLLDRLTLIPEFQAVAAHVTCSTQKQGIENNLVRVLNRLVPNWVRPKNISCCGFAGDKGFMLPELNESALIGLADEIKGCAYGISTSRTCEVGLSQQSGLTYYSLFEVLDRQSEEIQAPKAVTDEAST